MKDSENSQENEFSSYEEFWYLSEWLPEGWASLVDSEFLVLEVFKQRFGRIVDKSHVSGEQSTFGAPSSPLVYEINTG